MTNNLNITIIFCLLSICIYAQKNDTIYLLNGDRITGELKKLEYGLFTLNTDAMQKVYIQFDRINTIYSSKSFDIHTTSGFRYFGTISQSDLKATINIVTADDTLSKPLWDVIQITPVKRTLWKKIDGSINFGISYTKASEIFQYSLGGEVTHRTRNYYTRFSINNILTEDADDVITRNSDIGLTVTRYLPDKWFIRAQVESQKNTELNLDLRVQGGLGAGYDLVRTSSKRFYGLLAFLGNEEKTLDTSLVTYNFEGLISLQYKWYKYRSPKIDVTSGFNYYPSFTVAGRHRVEYDLQAKFEIITDLFFSIQLYDNFDKNPNAEMVKNNDWGIVTSIGYSF
ncbi:MAG: DUF481 domain-containing protein [Bacteroidales bacterium]